MTVQDTSNKVQYTGDGSTVGPYIFTYPTDETWIDVYVSGLIVSDTTYTLTVNADQDASPGGDVVFDTAVADGESIVILRTAPITQESDYNPFDAFPSERVEGDFDKSIIIDQQLDEVMDRALILPVDSSVDSTIPPPISLGYWRWNSDATAIEYVDLDNLGNPTDSSVITYNAGNNWVGGVLRSQENKNADMPSALDFGAIGNGITNDTTAITALDDAFSHRQIDLRGLTYVVNAIPTNNLYFNGVFSEFGRLHVQTLPVKTMGSPMVEDFNANASLLYQWDTIAGAGGTSIGIQSIAFSENERRVYTLHLDGVGSGNNSTINRYEMDGDIGALTQGNSTPVSQVAGHQGLAVESGNNRLWSTSFADKNDAVRYIYTDSAALSGAEIFTLFDNTEFETSVSCTPTISYGQKYLLAYGTKTGAADTTVRVWDFAAMVAKGPGDHKDDYIFTWDTQGAVSATRPTQGIASDGVYVWLIFGDIDINEDKRIYTFTLDGELIDFQTMTIGRAQALLDGAGTVYEPEGLSIFRNAAGGLMLCVGIVSGDLGTRFSRVYAVGLDMPIVCDEVNILGNTRSSIANSQSANRDFMALRARHAGGADGAGINLYGKDDSANPNTIGFVADGQADVAMVLDRAGNSMAFEMVGSGNGLVLPKVGFNGESPLTKPSVTDLATLLAALDAYGLITDDS